MTVVDTPPLFVLGIETSCDETAAAVVAAGTTICSSVISSQVDLHARFGGVVPEEAGRAHLVAVLPIVDEALERAGMNCSGSGTRGSIGAVAATVGPGLIGSLLVGVSAAKALALAWGVPFVGVNHLEGHLFAALLEDPALVLPAIVVIVSGGHTLLVFMDEPGRYRVVGETLDDAAGEAFDKVARYLELGYPGGPAIERAAQLGDGAAIAFSRPLGGNGLDLSFSGLKTAVIHYVRDHPDVATNDVAASFQACVIDVLVEKAIAAASATGARAICLGGGVAANGPLRDALKTACDVAGLACALPSRAMCTDNAAMIAAAGYFRFWRDGASPLETGVDPSLRFPTSSQAR